MAASSAYLRHDTPAASGWIAMALAMLGLAVACGYALALGELAGLYIGLSLAFAVAVLFDFRVGAVLLLVMLPMSASALFPRALMGITGLNPLNLLLIATIGAYLIGGRLKQVGPGSVLPPPVIWLFILPITIAGLMGMQHVHEIPPFFFEMESVSALTERQFLMVSVIKPFVIVAIGLMVGAAAARSQKPERFIIAIAVSALLLALIQIGFVISQGAPLAAMATPGERGFYEPMGMHANTLGRVHLFALALLLFVWAETRQPRLRLFLFVTLAVVGMALLLSFSRAAIFAAGLVGALFLVWKFNARTLALALVGLALIGLLAGEFLYARVTHGFDEGADAVSAGRIDGIWLPLLPEIAKSPLWGSGINSILWSYPMQTGSMMAVGHPHNAYLEALLDMGVIGLVLMLAYYAHVWRGFRALSQADWLPPQMRGLFQGATAALAAYLITCLVGSSLRPEVESAYLWIPIGLMYGLRGLQPAR